jgi:tape measure domain-containing protein
MANRNISATVQIGATMSATVGSVFGGLKKRIDDLGSSLSKLKKQSSEITKLQTAQGKLAEAKAKGSASAVARYSAEVEKLSKSLEAAGVDTSRLAHEQDRLASSIASSSARLATMTRIGASFGRIKTAAAGVGAAFGNVKSHIMGLTTKVAALGAGLGYLFKTQFVDVAAEYEKLQTMLVMQNGGDVAKAKQNFAWIADFAAKNALSIQDMTKMFVRMRNFGLNPMDGSMQSVIDQNAKMGGGIFETEGIVTALGQAWTKTKFQQEEALQLMERGVPVWDLLSKATGKSARELMDLSSKGELGRKTIALLIKEMGKNSAGAAAASSKTWDGLMRALSAQWERFTTTVMAEGLFDWMKDTIGGIIDDLNKAAKDGTLKAWAKKTGKSIREAFEETEKFARSAFKNVLAVKNLAGGWRNLGLAIAGVAFAPTIASILQLGISVSKLSFQIVALTAKGVIGGIVMLTNALRAMAVASWAAAGPWGAFAVGLIVAGAAIYTFKDDIMDLIDSAIDPLLDKLRAIGAWFADSKVGKFFGLDKYNLDGTPQAVRPALPFDRKSTDQEREALLKQIMPPENMPKTSQTNNVKNDWNVTINAPSGDPKAIIGALRDYAKSMPLYDSNGVLAPQ